MTYHTDKLPSNTRLDKEQFNGLQTSGGNHFASVAQIYLRCAGAEKDCHESISIVPIGGWGNETIDKISDKEAGEIFADNGWLVKGYNNNKHTRCPICRKKVKTKIIEGAIY